MRRSIAYVLASLAALSAGCASGVSGDEARDDAAGGPPNVALSNPTLVTPPAQVPVARALAGDRAFVDLGSKTSLPVAQCKTNAFCDDFEDATPGARWTSSTATDGVVDFAGPSVSLGAKALHVTTLGSGAAASAAYLTLAGPHVGTQWVGSLAFSMRLEKTPTTVVGGPEIAVVDANGAMTRIGFSIRPDGIAVHQFAGACTASSCASRSDLVTDVKPGEWRRLTVALETAGAAGPSFGRIEVTVDGGDLIMLPLSVMPFDGAAEIHAGITVGDSAPAEAHVDDLVFFTH